MEDDNLRLFPRHAELLQKILGYAPPGAAAVRAMLIERLGHQHASGMLGSRRCAETYLKSADAVLRYWALIALAFHWGPDEFVKQEFELISLTDPAPAVRKCALSCFYILYHATDRIHVGRVAATLTYDNSLPRELRLYAYRSLVELYKHRRITVWYPREAYSVDFRFPEDVDWNFVDRFLFPELGKRDRGQRNLDTHPLDAPWGEAKRGS